MKKLYEALFQAFEGKSYTVTKAKQEWAGSEWEGITADFAALSHFVAMKGKYYEAQQKCRFLLVGRAVNGWNSLPAGSAEEFGNAAQTQFDTVGFNWVKLEEGQLVNTDESYSLSHPFWNMAKSVWEQIHGPEDNPLWTDYIAWSNLYKIAPPHTDNPPKKMQNPQASICRKILKREIDTYKPTHILFLTGWDWFCDSPKKDRDFSPLLEEVRSIGRNARGNNIFVEGTARYQADWGTANVVIACRPEFRTSQPMLEQILSVFQEMEGN